MFGNIQFSIGSVSILGLVDKGLRPGTFRPKILILGVSILGLVDKGLRQ